MKFLEKFIIQAQRGDLGTKDYNEFWNEFDFKVKVSFGMGTAAKIPWISFLAPSMSTSQGFYPVYLYYKEQDVLFLSFGISETHSFQGTFESKDSSVNWSNKILQTYPEISSLIENPKRYGNSFCFKKYFPVVSKNKVLFLDENQKQINSDELRNDLVNILDIYSEELDFMFEKPEVNSQNNSIFSIESQLEDFIIENWDNTILSKKYELIVEEGEIVSQQFYAPGTEGDNHIDILAKDKNNGNYVVIELKKNQTNDDTIGQTLRYMGWIKKYKKDENVKGIIIAAKYDKKLNLALSMAPNIEAMTYEVDFKLRDHN